jgi:hypothetical protein
VIRQDFWSSSPAKLTTKNMVFIKEFKHDKILVTGQEKRKLILTAASNKTTKKGFNDMLSQKKMQPHCVTSEFCSIGFTVVCKLNDYARKSMFIFLKLKEFSFETAIKQTQK